MGVRAGNQVRRATASDVPELVEVLVRAFTGDPFHAWLFPDVEKREDRQRLLFQRVLGLYLRHGLVTTTADVSGVALWDPPREHGPSLVELAAFALKVLPVFGWRFALVARGMTPVTRMRPAEPHWYLAILGTDPARQRGGVGRALMTDVLERCDREGTTTYLEASRIENVPIYERFGFEVVLPLRMPSGPTVYRMTRPPRPMFRSTSPTSVPRRPPEVPRR